MLDSPYAIQEHAPDSRRAAVDDDFALIVAAREPQRRRTALDFCAEDGPWPSFATRVWGGVTKREGDCGCGGDGRYLRRPASFSRTTMPVCVSYWAGCLASFLIVTVVGEASDGLEAVRLVARHYPDTVLLDVDMPRLDGFGAAEVIRSFRPRTRLMLHTGAPDEEKRRRANALGLPLLDKLQLKGTTDLIEEHAVADQHSLANDIEPLVLLALAGRAEEGVLVVKADESIPFYNPAVELRLTYRFLPSR